MATPVISRFFRERFRAVRGEDAPTSVAAATGTLTRTTFATGSVTTEQLAERVAALLADLKAAGVVK